MDVKEAVQAAKQHIIDLFSEEGITQVGLEEIAETDFQDKWKITIGFSRTWDQGIARVLAGPPRIYKIVEIDKQSGHMVSITHRSLRVSE